MSTRKKWNFSSTVTQHYGLMALLTGSIGGLGAMSYWLYQEWINETDFSWFTFGGIRNEEDFVMTEDGAQLLGKPKTIKEIETIRAN